MVLLITLFQINLVEFFVYGQLALSCLGEWVDEESKLLNYPVDSTYNSRDVKSNLSTQRMEVPLDVHSINVQNTENQQMKDTTQHYAPTTHLRKTTETEDENVVRIIGARSINIKVMPSYVYIKSNKHSCTGNLISEKYVLTTASCVSDFYHGEDGMMEYRVKKSDEISLRMGSTYSTLGGQIYYATKINVHPDFLMNKLVLYYKDIAVITLMNPAKLDVSVKSADLHPFLSNRDIKKMRGTNCVVAGWGFKRRYKPITNKLLMANVTITSQLRCREHHFSADPTVHICASDISSKTCAGDPGAGLFCNGKILGLMSWNAECDVGKPDLYARVDNAQDFIKDAVSKFNILRSSPLVYILPLIFQFF